MLVTCDFHNFLQTAGVKGAGEALLYLYKFIVVIVVGAVEIVDNSPDLCEHSFFCS